MALLLWSVLSLVLILLFFLWSVLVAAFNMEGHILHTANSLHVNQYMLEDYIRLSKELLSSMQEY